LVPESVRVPAPTFVRFVPVPEITGAMERLSASTPMLELALRMISPVPVNELPPLTLRSAPVLAIPVALSVIVPPLLTA
jgi:hypothetical protein